MTDAGFENLTRAIASCASRRQVLKMLAGLLLPVPFRFQPTPSQPDLTGVWRTNNGRVLHVQQSGASVIGMPYQPPKPACTHNGVTPAENAPNAPTTPFIFQATLSGTQLKGQLWSCDLASAQWVPYPLQMTLSPDGNQLVGSFGPGGSDTASVQYTRERSAGPPASPAAPAAPAPPITPRPPAPRPAPAVPRDERYFSQTDFRVDDDAIWAHFQVMGAAVTFGYPASRTFKLLGCPVQIFQRAVIQHCPGQEPTLLNLLDPELFPYTVVNGSVFPAVDADLKALTPKVEDPDYGRRILQFVRDNAPDQWQGDAVNFAQTFFGTVATGQVDSQDSGVLGLKALEVWGAPTSRPQRDPNNPNFIYQRFQRGIMHYRADQKTTEGVLLADYFKAILLGPERAGAQLPVDLLSEAQGSRFLGQYCPGEQGWLCRPDQLGGTDLTFAFEPAGPIGPLPQVGTPNVTGLSTETQRILDELDRASRGQAANIYGDGLTTFQMNVSADGARHTQIVGGDGRLEYSSEWLDGRGGLVRIDRNRDGVVDWQAEYWVAPVPTRVILYDATFVGRMDARITETYSPDGSTVRVITENDPSGTGVFTKVSDGTFPLGVDAGLQPRCDAGAGFPADTSDPSVSVAKTIRILTNQGGTGGRCTPAQANRIRQAVDCAIQKGMNCLKQTNRRFAAELADALAGGLTESPLVIACGDTCAGSDANTKSGLWWAVPKGRETNTNVTPPDQISDQDLCTVMLHEMLHWAGERGSSRHDQDRSDSVYSCGRYCAGCTNRGLPSPPSGPNVDCARCADTQAEKAMCGVQRQLVSMVCPPLAFCHGGIGTNLVCTACQGYQDQACDGTPLYSTIGVRFACCQTCPPNASRFNDVPCGGVAPNDLGSCGQKPPFCP